MSMKSKTLTSLAAVLAACSLTSCGSEISTTTLENAYDLSIPSLDKYDGEITNEGPLKNYETSTDTSTYAYLIGYQKLSDKKVSTWLEENRNALLPSELALRTTEQPKTSSTQMHNAFYSPGTSYCYANNRNADLRAPHAISITPWFADDSDADYPVLLEVDTFQNSLGCQDSEYESVVEPLLQQQQSGGKSWADVAGTLLDSLMQ